MVKAGALSKYLILITICFLQVAGRTYAQDYDLLLKNGHVIDPKNQVDAKRDVAIRNGKIVKVASSIPGKDALKVVDLAGLYLSPGFIDIHTHVFAGSKPETFADGSFSVSPDDFTLKSGVTTVVDAGTSGWRNFSLFKTNIIDKSKTRVYAWLNIAGNGMTGSPGEQDMNDMDARLAAMTVSKFRENIVGIKIGHFEGTEWAPFERAREAAEKSSTPLFVECHLPQYSLEEQLKNMRRGDIITHAFEKVSERTPVVNNEGELYSYVKEAQQRGILFDLGHGGAGFWFSVAVPAMKNGLPPNTFGTDLHRFSMNAGMKDMMNVMSKYLAMGMPLTDVVQRASWNAAKAIQHEELGNLGEGALADICVFRIRDGNFGYVDAGGNVLTGNKKLEAELTIINGKIVFDLNGLSAQPFKIK